jgi:hypothetical protein
MTLGEYRKLAAYAYGEDSKVVEFLDRKIKESPQGADEPVLAHETQMISLLSNLHRRQ